MSRARPSLVVLLAVALGAAVGAGCSSTAGDAPGGAVRVVAAENFWGDIAAQIGGARVAVTSLLHDPGTDPHQFESDAHDAAAMADARVVIVNGLGYDDFASKLLDVTRHRGRVVVTVADVLHVSGADANPHLWYDIARIPEVARAIETQLVAAAPEDASLFAANLRTFETALVPLRRALTDIATRYPHAPVAYTERVPQYILDAAGLDVVTPAGFARAIEDGNEPSPGDAQTMYDLISGHRIRALLYNAQATSAVTRHVQDLARRAGVPVVAVTETQPAGDATYQAWQLRQLDDLRRALGR